MDNLDFVQAFKIGENLNTEFGEITFATHNIGELLLTSGKLVACDPLVSPDTEPFTLNIKPGRYPVILSVAHIPKNNEWRVAYAMLRLSEQTPVRWELATVAGESLSSLEEDEVFGYGVDAGTGCFMDADAAQIIDTLSWNGDETFFDKLMEAMEKNYTPTWNWANLSIDESSEANVIAFKSGWGDGVYASYCGYDTKNNLVNVVTDFELFDNI